MSLSLLLEGFLSGVYVLCAALLAIYAGSQFLLLGMYLWHRRRPLTTPTLAEWPPVVVQLPLFNERHVAPRLLAAAASLDYPREHLTIQVLDDSTDDTGGIVAAEVARWRAQGVDMHHIHRDGRDGFKAGALAHGLTLVPNAALAAIFDADFMPPPDFLRRVVPHFQQGDDLGMVQTRWGHLNSDANPLTRAQTLALDNHFVVEQFARCRGGWPMSFNGSGGVWRTACIRAAGGWLPRTLTEDLDLSYRAQFAGWRFLYLPEISVPGELPPQIAAYKRQQARWARGTTQCLRALLLPLWRSQMNIGQKLMGTLHLCQYLPHPLMLTLLLLTPPLLALDALNGLPLGFLGLTGLAAPIAYLLSQQALYHDWPRRLLACPALVALGTGIAWSNSRAAVGGLLGHSKPFERTPKFDHDWPASRYALKAGSSLPELALALYALFGMGLALAFNSAFAPYLAIYAFSFGTVALWGVFEQRAARRYHRNKP